MRVKEGKCVRAAGDGRIGGNGGEGRGYWWWVLGMGWDHRVALDVVLFGPQLTEVPSIEFVPSFGDDERAAIQELG